MTKSATSHKQNKISPARVAALLVLVRVERDHAYSDLAWQEERQRLSVLDAGLAQEVIFGVLTWRRLLDHWIQSLSKISLDRISLEVLMVLRMALFQLRFLERVPAYAVLNDAVEQAKSSSKGAASFVNGVLRTALREDDYLPPIRDIGDCEHTSKAKWGVQLSYPDWMVDYFVRHFGEMACQVMLALNHKPVRAVRVNTRKGNRAHVIELLQQEGVDAEPSPISPYGIRLAPGTQPLRLHAYREGLISLQGESSMLVAPLFGDLRGKSFLDACAAPGGKGLHVAEIAGAADVTMVELHQNRAQVIRDQAARLDISAQIVVGDARAVNGSFDAVLLDAPCSGLGTIARKPDIKWRIKPRDMASLALVQSELLDAMASCIKPAGTLVYTTCTLSPQENEVQIQGFLSRHPEFYLQPIHEMDEVATTYANHNHQTKMTYILPQDFHGDGFFLARLVRRDN